MSLCHSSPRAGACPGGVLAPLVNRHPPLKARRLWVPTGQVANPPSAHRALCTRHHPCPALAPPFPLHVLSQETPRPLLARPPSPRPLRFCTPSALPTCSLSDLFAGLSLFMTQILLCARQIGPSLPHSAPGTDPHPHSGHWCPVLFHSGLCASHGNLETLPPATSPELAE